MKFMLIALAASIALSDHSFANEEQNKAVREATSNLKSHVDTHAQQYGVDNKADALRPILVTIREYVITAEADETWKKNILHGSHLIQTLCTAWPHDVVGDEHNDYLKDLLDLYETLAEEINTRNEMMNKADEFLSLWENELRREYAENLVADALKEAGIGSDADVDVDLINGMVVIAIDGVDDCDDGDQQAVAEGIARDMQAESENIGQKPLAITTYCQEYEPKWSETEANSRAIIPCFWISSEDRCEKCNLCETLDIDPSSQAYKDAVAKDKLREAEEQKHRKEREEACADRKGEECTRKEVRATVVIEIDEVDSCDDVDTRSIEEGIAEDLLAASENIGQEPLAITTYCQENDSGPAAGGNAP
jgi:hypothetical protein